MPYNASGVYSLPAGYAGTPGTTIFSGQQHNAPLEDVRSALNLAFLRDGRAPMTGPITLAADGALPMHPVTKQQFDVLSGAAALKASNLSDLANASTALTNLGAGATGKNLLYAATVGSARALLQVEQASPIKTHSFPADLGCTGTKYFQDASGNWFAAKVYEGKTVASLEIYAETSPGRFGASPVATRDIDYPHGLDVIVEGAFTYIGVTSYRKAAYAVDQSDYYDSLSYILNFTGGNTLTPVFTFQTYGAKRIEFLRRGNGSITGTVANSISNSRNTSGNPVYPNCTEQSVMRLTLAGTTWSVSQDMPCSGSPYHAKPYEVGGVLKWGVARYYDAGVTENAPSALRYRVPALIIPEVGGLFSVANATHEIPSKGGSSVAITIKDRREIAIVGYQRDDGAFGGVDRTHFETMTPFWELMPNGRVEPLGEAVPNFNCYMVRTVEVGSSTIVQFCNASSGGSYPTNFNEGGVTYYRMDERTFRPAPMSRVPAEGVFDVSTVKRGDVYYSTFACAQAGEDGSYIYSLPSTCYLIGDLMASGAETDSSSFPRPVALKRRLLNGSMQVSQVNGTNAGTANGYIAADRWSLDYSNLTGTATIQKVDQVTLNGSPSRLVLTMTTACSLSSSTGYLAFRRELKGYDVQDMLWGSTLGTAGILRFMFRSNIACTVAVQIGNAAGTHSFTTTFQISADEAASNGVETVQKIWIPQALRTSGVWPAGNATAGYIRFVVAAGVNAIGSRAGWRAGSHVAAPGITNNIGTAGTYFHLSEVELYADRHWQCFNPLWECPDYESEVRALSGLATPLADNSVTNAALRDSTSLSVIGRAVASNGDPADIIANADATVLRRNGSALEWSKIDPVNISDRSAVSVFGRAANSAGVAADIAAAADGQYLRRSGGIVAFGAPPAADIVNTPAGSIAATTVQAALNELDTEKAALAGATFTGALNGTSLSMSGNITSTAGDVTGLAFNSSVTGTAEQYAMVARRSGVARGYLAFTNADMFQIYLYNSSGTFLSNPLKAFGNGSIQVDGPVVMRSYAKASLPAAGSFTGGMIYVTDDAGGATPAFSDGSSWRRVADRIVIA